MPRGANDEHFNAVTQTVGGGYLLAGGTNSTDGDVRGYHGGFRDAWVTKLTFDTTGPVTTVKATPTSTKVKRLVTLTCTVTDDLSRTAKNITVAVTAKSKRPVTIKTLTTVQMEKPLTAKWTPKAKGVYTITVKAKDEAGNAQRMAGTVKITVR